mgnify:CR=1 FL=1
MIELVQIRKLGDESFQLSTIYINPQHIVSLSEDRIYKNYLTEGKIKIGLNRGTVFTKVKVHEGNTTSDVIVVGDPSTVQSKLFKKSLRLLRD